MAKKKLLVLEDEDDLRDLLVENLRAAGYEVASARDGEEGLDLARRSIPDLIITDVVMPRKNGNQFIQEFRKSVRGSDRVPVIVLTARARMRDYFEAIKVYDFVDKPFKIGELLGTIERALGIPPDGLPPSSKAARRPWKPEDGLSDKAEMMFDEQATRQRNIQMGDKDASAGYSGIGSAPARSSLAKPVPVRKRIVIIENETDVCHELDVLFSVRGYATHPVYHVEEFVQEAVRAKPDLIILKNAFLKVNAEEMAGRMRSVQALRDVPIIIYGQIGEWIEHELNAGIKKKVFVLNPEGRALLTKIDELLA
ncbi:MAG: response regulator [Candidatus Omnitrophota bacterium]|nr:response regulator [Candidatus Omnitrophota bacterium]MDZ4243241.1 response regulator [Candidatus Omnitrophota bacterium]